MLSHRAKNIIEDVDNVQNDIDIKYLLQKYPEKFEKDFIQKYIETKISFFSNKITRLSFIFALLTIISATILNVSLLLYSEYVQQYKLLYNIGLIISLAFFAFVMFFYVKEFAEKNVLEEIIIAIEDDDKLSIKEQGISIVAPEQDDISSNSNVDIPSTNFKSGISSTDKKIKQSGIQLKYHQILEEHRWITNLIWNKIHALIVVNGILFSAFNLLVIADQKSNFIIQKASLIIVGFLISIFGFFILEHSINFKENYRNQIFKIQQDYPDFSINYIDVHHSWRGIFGTNVAARISTIGLSVLWLILLIVFL